MAEASTLSVGKASVANDDTKSQPVASTSKDPSLSKYLQTVETEKQEWKEYAMSLKKQYHDLKKDVAKGTKIWSENVNNQVPTIHHLPDEEKDFLSEIQKTLEDRIYIKNELAKQKEKIQLMQETVENQKAFNMSLLNSYFLNRETKD